MTKTKGLSAPLVILTLALVGLVLGITSQLIRGVRNRFSPNRNVSPTATLRTGQTGASYVVTPRVADGSNCTQKVAFWLDNTGSKGQSDLITRLLPIRLGQTGGGKSISVTTSTQAVSVLSKNQDNENGLNRLSAQLLAAKLNIARGSDAKSVSTEIAASDDLLTQFKGAEWNNLSSQQKITASTWATKLDDYNNGFLGPGFCAK